MPLISSSQAKKNLVTGIFAAGAGALLIAGITTSPALAAPAAGDSTTLPVCHTTGSSSNPYHQIIVAKSSIVSSRPRYENDIFPPFAYVDGSGQTIQFPGQNWTPSNEVIYSTGCGAVAPSPSPTQTVVPSPTQTVVPSPTQTVVPSPTQTVVPSPTATATTAAPNPSSTAKPSDPPVVADPAPSTSPSNAPLTTTPSSPPASSPSTPSDPADPAPSSLPVTGSSDPVVPVGVVPAGTVVAEQGATPAEVSLRAQTAAGAPTPDYTESNLFFASAFLLLIGVITPRVRGRRVLLERVERVERVERAERPQDQDYS